MSDRRDRLEKLLHGLPEHIPPSFTSWHFTANMRRRVQQRVAVLQNIFIHPGIPAGEPCRDNDTGDGWAAPPAKVSSERAASRRRYFGLAGIAALALVLILLMGRAGPVVPGHGYGEEVVPPVGFRVKPLQYQRVSLDNPPREAIVSIGRVEGSDQLLAAVSKKREPEGWELVYTQPLNAYVVLPLEVMDGGSDRAALILIVYQEQEKAVYRHLILRFDGERVIPYIQ